MVRATLVLIPLIILTFFPTASWSQGLIANVELTWVSFSPNGDGKQDDTRVTITLSDTATVDVLIFSSDSTTTVSTLASGLQTASVSATWDGTFTNGTPVPDDTYLVFIRAQSTTATDSTYRAVFVDNTPPQAVITNVFPFLFGPGSPDPLSTHLTIEYTVIDPPPSQKAQDQGSG